MLRKGNDVYDWKGILSGVLASALAAAAVGALKTQPWNAFDYAGATEEKQQAYLEKLAGRIEKGLVKGAKGGAKVTKLKADAARNEIRADIQFTDPRADHATQGDFAPMTAMVQADFCREATTRNLVSEGVAIKITFVRPTRGPVTSLTFDRSRCTS